MSALFKGGGTPSATVFSHASPPDTLFPFRPNGMVLLSASGEGPVIALWDRQQKGRLILSVEQDDPQLTLHTAEGKQAVLLRADPANGRGYVAILDNGLPRTVMKAAPDNAGVVSVVHDDGHARVLLHGTEDTGTFMTVNPDLKTTVKISSAPPWAVAWSSSSAPTASPPSSSPITTARVALSTPTARMASPPPASRRRGLERRATRGECPRSSVRNHGVSTRGRARDG